MRLLFPSLCCCSLASAISALIRPLVQSETGCSQAAGLASRSVEESVPYRLRLNTPHQDFARRGSRASVQAYLGGQ
jgi:hypothetical protein